MLRHIASRLIQTTNITTNIYYRNGNNFIRSNSSDNNDKYHTGKQDNKKYQQNIVNMNNKIEELNKAHDKDQSIIIILDVDLSGIETIMKEADENYGTYHY